MLRWIGWILAAGIVLLIVGGVLTFVWLWLVFAGGLTAPWPDWPVD